MARRIPAQVVEHFRGIPLFSTLSKRALRSVAQAADEVDEPSGKAFVVEGEGDRSLYVLVEGTAVVTRGGRKVANLRPGDFFGELAVLDHGPRSATVTSTSACRLMALDARRIDELVHHEPTIAQGMLEVLAARLRETDRSLTD